jgi:hypothetical protein
MAGRLIEDETIVLDYLVDTAGKSRGTDPLPFTKPAIAKATRIEETAVGNAITKIEDEVNEHLVYVKVYLPETRAGERVYRRFVTAGLVSRSAFAAMFIVLASMFLLAYNYPLRWIEAVNSGEAQAYRRGATNALFCAGTAGLLLAGGLRRLLTGHLHWKTKNEETHAKVSQVSKVSILSGLALAALYVATFGWFGHPVSGAFAVGLFLSGFPIGWAYWALITRRDD